MSAPAASGSVNNADHRSSVTTSGSTITAGRPKTGRSTRSIPPWVTTYDPDLGVPPEEAVRQLNAPPAAAHPQQKKAANDLKRRVSKDGYEQWVDEKHGQTSNLPRILRKRADKPGRKWDHLRTAEPVIMGTGYRPPGSDPYAQWRDMIHSSWSGRGADDSEIVTEEYLNQLQPGLDDDSPALVYSMDPKLSGSSRKQRFIDRFWDFMLRHPATPLLFRLIVLGTSIAALVVSVHIYRQEKPQSKTDKDDPDFSTDQNREAEFNQAIFALVVDVIAIPYIGYMTWDEYTGKPLGLRPAVQKISLTLLDLFFIIFKSASTSLAFQALIYRGNDPTMNKPLTVNLAKALAGLMLAGLIAWVINFTISVFRLVERLGGVDSRSRLR